MSAVDALLAEYDSCKNAAARAAWLEPHQLKAKGTIAALREGFLHHVCNCKSPVLESTLAKTTPAPGSLPVGEDPGGKGCPRCFLLLGGDLAEEASLCAPVLPQRLLASYEKPWGQKHHSCCRHGLEVQKHLERHQVCAVSKCREAPGGHGES